MGCYGKTSPALTPLTVESQTFYSVTVQVERPHGSAEFE